MTDSVNVFPPFWRFLDANGDPVAGGYLEFYLAGSSTPLSVYSDAGLTSALGTTVYCDSGGHPVASSGSSTKVTIWTGTTDYKVVGKTSSGTTLGTLDNFPGAADTSNYAVTSARPIGNTVAKASTTWSASTTDGSGTLYNANVAGGSQVVTLPSAVTAGNGYILGIRHDGQGSSNTVTYQTVGGQAIKEGHASASVAAGTLTAYGETKWFQSDEAGWTLYSYVPPLTRRGEQLVVTDRLTAAPTSPAASAVYLINGTPTGTWLALGFADKGLVQASGVGTWTELAVSDGMIVYVADESMLVQRRGSAWVDLSNIVAPETTYLGTWHGTYQTTSGTTALTLATSAWTKHSINTEKANTITGAALASNQVTLPAGKYMVLGGGSIQGTAGATGFRLANGDASVVYGSAQGQAPSGGTYTGTAVGIFDFSAASNTVELQYWSTAANAAGVVLSDSGVETYAWLTIIALQVEQGPQGGQGTQGNDGDDGVDGADAGLSYTFNSSTSAADPGTGKVAFDSATPALITAVYLSETDADGNALASEIASWDDGSNSVKTRLRFQKGGDPTKVLVLDVTGTLTDNGGWDTLIVAYVRHTGAFTNLDGLKLSPGLKGDKGEAGSAGDDGATGAAAPAFIDYSLDPSSTADSDPGSGKLRPDNATAASVTTFYFDDLDRLGNSQAAELATWDDSTSTGVKGKLYIIDLTTPANRWTYDVTAFTAATGYSKITVTHRSGSAAWPTGNVGLLFVPRGDAGSGNISGGVGSTDNRIPRSDGAGGVTLQATGITVDDSDNVSGIGNLTLTGTVDGRDVAADGTKLDYITVTQAVDLDAIEARVTELDASVILKGTWDASAGTFPGSGSAQAGWSYIVSVPGTVDSIAFSVNDRVIAITDNASTSTYAANWIKADYTDQVLSVAGRTGAVTLSTSDVSGLGTAAVLDETTTAQFRANTADKVLSTDQVWAAAALVTLTDGATITPDFSAGLNFVVTLGGNRTLANPTNVKEGQSGVLLVKQDATGSRTLTWGSNWKWAGATAPTLTTTASRTDKVFFFAESSSIIHASVEKDSR